MTTQVTFGPKLSFEENDFIKKAPEEVEGLSSLGMISFVGNESVVDDRNRVLMRMCLDMSGSMSDRDLKTGRSKYDDLMNTLKNMGSYLVDTPNLQGMDLWVEVYVFNHQSRLILPMTKITGENPAVIKEIFSSLRDKVEPQGTTNIELALKDYFSRDKTALTERNECLQKIDELKQLLMQPSADPSECLKVCDQAREQFEKLSQIPAGIRHVHCMFSDGEATVGDKDMSRVAQTFIDDTAEMWYIGYGSSHSASDMRKLDKDEGRYLAITETEHAGYAAGLVIDAVTNPGYSNVTFTIENGQLFDGLNNAWVDTLYIGSLDPVKKVEHYFRYESDPESVKISMTAKNVITQEFFTQVFSPASEMSEIQAVKAISRINTLKHLKNVNDRNLGINMELTLKSLFSSLELFLFELDLAKTFCVGHEMEMEDLIADIKIVMATMGRGARSVIFSTRLFNNWFCQPLRISTIYPEDTSVADYGNERFAAAIVNCNGILGRELSDNISPRCIEAMRSLSQPVDIEDTFATEVKRWRGDDNV